MKRRNKIILLLSLVSLLLVYFAVPVNALASSVNAETHYPLIFIQMDYTEEGTTYVGHFTDQLSFPGSLVNNGSATSTYTLYTSAWGSLKREINTFSYLTDDYGGKITSHNRYLYNVGANSGASLTSFKIVAEDFYMPSSENDDLGFFLDFNGVEDLNLSFDFTIVLRRIGSDQWDTVTYTAPYCSFRAQDLPRSTYRPGGRFLGCYVKELTVVPSPGSDLPFSTTYDGKQQISFDLTFDYYSAEVYDRVVLDDPIRPDLEASEYYVDYTSWIGTAIGGFFDLQLFYGFTLGGIVLIVVSFAVAVWLLKVFAGG